MASVGALALRADAESGGRRASRRLVCVRSWAAAVGRVGVMRPWCSLKDGRDVCRDESH